MTVSEKGESFVEYERRQGKVVAEMLQQVAEQWFSEAPFKSSTSVKQLSPDGRYHSDITYSTRTRSHYDGRGSQPSAVELGEEDLKFEEGSISPILDLVNEWAPILKTIQSRTNFQSLK
jgi:hypothetical protein